MRALSFGFRDYAVHLFPGCLTISAFLFLFLDFTWVTPSFAPLLALLYLIGGYLAGFFIDTITAVLVRKKYIWKISGGDPLRDYFKGVHLKGSPRDLKDCAAQILLRDYGESFVRKQEFKELMYLMMRSVEAANERSAAFLSRINALENMAVNTGISCFWVTGVLLINTAVFPEQFGISLSLAAFFLIMGVILLRRRTRYRSWLAKSVIRAFVALDRQSSAKNEAEKPE